MRLIDADKVYPWYLETFANLIGPNVVRFSMNDINGNLDNIPTEIPNKWIPVSEGLPKEDGEYFVTRKWTVNHYYVEKLYFANNLNLVDEFDFPDEKRPGWYEHDSEYGHYEVNNVVAWMPLPEPYVPES